MAQLDQDVHDDVDLSRTEVSLALRLIGTVPRSVFLPCFGTGRHIPHLLDKGVERIVGVDLSPVCVEKARRQVGDNYRVELHTGDLQSWKTAERFDAVILLGNSFGDIVDRDLLNRVTGGMVAPLREKGVFVMDYIGERYVFRCGGSTSWESTYDGHKVIDTRTPYYDPLTRVMTINVSATDLESGEELWAGHYQKLILTGEETEEHLLQHGVAITARGLARELNTEYHGWANLGMLAESTWWVGQRIQSFKWW